MLEAISVRASDVFSLHLLSSRFSIYRTMASDPCQVIESRLVDPKKLIDLLEQQYGKDSFRVEVGLLENRASANCY